MFVVNNKMSKSNVSRTIRFTEEIFEDLSRIANAENISFNQLVLQCCKYAINNYVEGNQEQKK